MKRAAALSSILFLLILSVSLCQAALDPDDFTGQWYSSQDQCVYLFQDGLIYCPQHAVIATDMGPLCGAYSFGKRSVFLYAHGIEGLERERELYLVHGDEVSFLCYKKDGSGKSYFMRYCK